MKFFNIPTDEDDADAKQKQEKYNKVSSKTVGVLKQEVFDFVDLMKSLGKDVTQQQAESTFGIQDYTSMSEQQAVTTINNIQAMAKNIRRIRMINRVVLVGRLTKDPEFRTTPNGVNVATFTLAVNRTFTNANGEREADFINVVVFRNQADNVNNYLRKGQLAGVDGRIQSRSYENQEGRRIFVIEIVADSVQFLEPKNNNQQNNQPQQQRGQASAGNNPLVITTQM